MPTNRLSDAALRAIKPSGAPFKLSDGGGLHLLVNPNGGRMWRLAYRFDGKQKTLALGTYPTVGLAESRDARDRAKKLLSQGADPGVAKRMRADIPQEEGPPTFAVVAQAWFKARKAGWVAGYAARVESRVQEDLVSDLGETPIDQIDSTQLLATLRKIEARGAVETAHRVKNYASDIFRFARAARYVTANPADELERALATPAPQKRRAALKARDLPAFLQALEGYDGEALTALAMKLTLLTFVRTKELRFTRWDEFEDLDGPMPLWRIPALRMKMPNEHLVPLSSQAVRTLERLRHQSGGEPLVFAAKTVSGVISENTMLYAMYRLGYHSRATMHGFRGTASTILNEHGFNRDWIELQLAHVEQDQVRAAYNVAEWLPERRTMLQWWGDYLEERGLKSPAKA